MNVTTITVALAAVTVTFPVPTVGSASRAARMALAVFAGVAGS